MPEEDKNEWKITPVLKGLPVRSTVIAGGIRSTVAVGPHCSGANVFSEFCFTFVWPVSSCKSSSIPCELEQGWWRSKCSPDFDVGVLVWLNCQDDGKHFLLFRHTHAEHMLRGIQERPVCEALVWRCYQIRMLLRQHRVCFWGALPTMSCAEFR